MLLIHPIVQFVATVMAFYAMTLGIARFKTVHLNQKARFNWKRHVRVGLMASVIWLLGILGGLYMVKTSWYAWMITGSHSNLGIGMIPFILFAIGSGLYMDKKKAKRKALPLAHAICNLIMLALALAQIYTGVVTYRVYVLGL